MMVFVGGFNLFVTYYRQAVKQTYRLTDNQSLL